PPSAYTALFPYTTLFRSLRAIALHVQTDPVLAGVDMGAGFFQLEQYRFEGAGIGVLHAYPAAGDRASHQEGAGFNPVGHHRVTRSEEHTSELQSRENLVC